MSSDVTATFPHFSQAITVTSLVTSSGTTEREPNNEVLVGLFYAFIGTFSYGLISVLVTMTSALNFSPFYLLLIRAVFQVIFFSVINLIRSKGERDAELTVVELVY